VNKTEVIEHMRLTGRIPCSLQCSTNPGKKTTTSLIVTTLSMLFVLGAGCRSATEPPDVRPLVLRDVPAQRLAYRFEPDVGIPAELPPEDVPEKLATIQTDFDSRRPNDALMRTVISPDGQRALVLYGTEDEPRQAFRIDIYAVDGKFLRNLTPPDLACVFAETVSWSPDGNNITFVAQKNVRPTPSPTPLEETDPDEVAPLPSPSVAPAFPAVASFNTEQIYISNRDGYDLKPLTTREGLIYFYYSWSPDGHALVALACKEEEWNARALVFRLPAGRPRIITLDGNERLLDDTMTEALPVWCPDSSKVATAFETDVGIYDAGGRTPTHARAPMRSALLAASRTFQQRMAGNTNAETKNRAEQVNVQDDSPPPSFNPIVRLEWPAPDRLYVQTAYVRLYPNEPINTFQRWHRLVITAQAAVLK
jgi:hypothetical protein